MKHRVTCIKDVVVGNITACKRGHTYEVEEKNVSFEESYVYPHLEDLDDIRRFIPNTHDSKAYILKNDWATLTFYDDDRTARHYRGMNFHSYFEKEKMVLTAENVEKIHKECLDKPENMGTCDIDGVLHWYTYNKKKLEENRKNITDMLSQLPENFYKNSGGGWSFLNMCMRADDVQWTGLHLTVEHLVCLGIAVGKVKFLLPKAMWKILPGEMPYIVIEL